MNLPDEKLMNMMLLFYGANIAALLLSGIVTYFIGALEGLITFSVSVVALIFLIQLHQSNRD